MSEIIDKIKNILKIDKIIESFVNESLTPILQLPKEERTVFFRWAFGEGFTGKEKISHIPILWNKQHKDLLEIHSLDHRCRTERKMVDLWREANND